MGAGYVTKVDSTHRVILTIDGRRVFQQDAGGPEDLKAVDQRQAIAADEMQNRFNHISVQVKAGVRRVGVAFVQRSLAQSDSPLQPIAMLPEMERAPNIPGRRCRGRSMSRASARRRAGDACLHVVPPLPQKSCRARAASWAISQRQRSAVRSRMKISRHRWSSTRAPARCRILMPASRAV